MHSRNQRRVENAGVGSTSVVQLARGQMFVRVGRVKEYEQYMCADRIIMRYLVKIPFRLIWREHRTKHEKTTPN